MTKSNKVLTVIVGALISFSAPVYADEFPSTTIKIVHGSSAGAPQDVMLRRLAPLIEQQAGVSVVVEPRPGGSGQAAMAYLKGQPADGYTIFSDGTGITSILQLPGAAHSWKDFQALYQIQLDPFALYVKADGKFEGLEDFVQSMKDNPGKIRVGGYGSGSPHHLMVQALAKKADAQITWIPYSSGTDAITAVMSGDIEAALSNVSVADRFKERTRLLAVSSEEKIPGLENIPTFKDKNYDLVKYHWRGVFLKNGTPKEIVDKLYQIFDVAVKSEEFKSYFDKSRTLHSGISIKDFEDLLTAQATEDREALIELKLIRE